MRETLVRGRCHGNEEFPCATVKMIAALKPFPVGERRLHVYSLPPQAHENGSQYGKAIRETKRAKEPVERVR